jgi:hypothetical protein
MRRLAPVIEWALEVGVLAGLLYQSTTWRGLLITDGRTWLWTTVVLCGAVACVQWFALAGRHLHSAVRLRLVLLTGQTVFWSLFLVLVLESQLSAGVVTKNMMLFAATEGLPLEGDCVCDNLKRR